MSKLAKALTAAAGNAGGDNLYVEDVFSTYLYKGNGTSQTITNGIDLDGEGGMVWLKSRDQAYSHTLYDTDRGATKYIISNATSAESTLATGLTSFNSDGFTHGSHMSTDNVASWTFRKAEKFFDVVTWTGDGVAGREIAHNLGSVPGCMLVKRTDSSWDWFVWHESLGSSANGDSYLELNTTNPENDGFGKFYWGDGVTYIPPTSSSFTVNAASAVNLSGATYVAYLFAHDAGGFGDDGSESIIKCGVLTSTSSGFVDADCGFEPQWLLIKGTMTNNWQLFDNMRGVTTGNGHERLFANTSGAESSSTSDAINFTATGFKANTFTGGFNGAGDYIYIAIRRPMKTPESGTEVFAVAENIYPTENVAPGWRSSFTVDMTMNRRTGRAEGMSVTSRLQGGRYAQTSSTYAEGAGTYVYDFGFQTGAHVYLDNGGLNYAYMFKRATGFFDVVAYTGNGVASRTVAHNLGVAPELMIIKQRNASRDWSVYNSDVGATKVLHLQWNGAAYVDSSMFDNTDPTSTVFTVDTNNTVNAVGGTFIAYLFATLAGVSKVGSYTGTGSNVDVDCGFSAGARFILIKRTDSTGDWYVWDSARGIVAGNDPYLLLNTTAAQVTSTDYIDPLSSGFTVTSSAPAALNASGGTYIFLAIA